jgi:UDP-N-acetylmuramate: L-alanyl-gamma-D-glutamyl-meso-diaminopimelate ligase
LIEAGIAFIYFNPENIFPDLDKNLSIEIIRSAFGKRNNIEIFTDINSLQIKLKTINFNESTLLFMSTGNFSGVNLSEFAQDLLKKQGTN